MPRTFDVPLGHLALDDVRVWSTPAHGVEPLEEMDDGPTPGGVGGVSVHRRPVELDMRALGLQDVQPNIRGPLEKRSQVVAVGIEGSAAVPSQEGRSGDLRLVEEGITIDDEVSRVRVEIGHCLPPKG